jgi:hypothetical protein
VGVKDNLKGIIQRHIGDVVSSFFLAKSLAIINESADNKEGVIAAADRICKRIALFIDKDLAQTVFESLKAEIEKKPHFMEQKGDTHIKSVELRS